jgi:hypothetical protein
VKGTKSMKRFSILLDSNNQKEFTVEAKVTLKIKSESSGEVGYLSDSILGSIESIEDFEIINIKERDENI